MNMRGFTLLEVLVALAVLAISATAVIRQTSGSLNSMEALEMRTAAAVLADNYLQQAIIADAFPAVGRSSKEITFQERRWWVKTDVSKTSDPWLRKIEISVSTGELSDDPTVVLTGYRGQH